MGWIRSKPVYATLAPVTGGGRHVFVSMGEPGAFAVERALPGLADFIHLHAGEGCPPTAEKLRSFDFLLVRLRAVLEAAPVSTALCVAGPEQDVWRCCRVGRECGMTRDRIFPELAGSAARTVYCVHCKAHAPDVTTSLVECRGCGQTLFVRDHFSRLLAAYAGVRVDAEVPGDLPGREEIYA
jgi:dimethylamine monooxygenase subunit C